jgi:hypothetical protein
MSKEKIAMLTVMVLFGDSTLRADSLDHWAKRNSDGQTNTLNAVVFGNSLFVAVGDTILTSPDGTFWTPAKDAPAGLTGVAWGNDRYVAVGLDQTILTSSDGSNWTKQNGARPDGTGVNLLGVGYGDGLFVAVGGTRSGHVTYPVLQSSPDGLSWTDHSPFVGANWNWFLDSVAQGNGQYIVAGTFGGVSSNGVDWVWPQDPVPDPYFPVSHNAFGNGTFVAVTTLGDIFMGGSWVQRGREADPNVKDRFSDVFYGHGHYIAVGLKLDDTVSTNPVVAPLIKTSIDGANWILRNVDALPPEKVPSYGPYVYPTLYGLSFGRNTFVAVGGRGTILQSDDVTEPAFLVREMERSTDGSVRLGIQSSVGDSIIVESSDDLASWMPLTTVTNLTGVVLVTDSGGQNSRHRFYRAKLPAR